MEINVSGPIFDGRADAAMKDFQKDLEKRLADETNEELHNQFDRTFKTQTPYYATQVQVHREEGGHVVHDGGVAYGPWLEGVGSRNGSTRFKGYFNYRRTAQIMEAEAPRIAERMLPRYIRRMD